MIRHAMAMLVAVAVAVVATVASGHAVRMDHHPNLTTHTSNVAATEAHDDDPTCIVAQACDPASDELCLFVCAGLLNFNFSDQGTLVLERRTIGLKFPGVTVVGGHDPGRNDRPPISYLL